MEETIIKSKFISEDLTINWVLVMNISKFFIDILISIKNLFSCSFNKFSSK
jgi:hypothetical protein